MRFSGALSIVLSVAGLAGGAIAVFLTTSYKEAMNLLRATNDDQGKRIVVLEATERRCADEVTHLHVQVGVLTEAVTNAAAVAELAKQVATNHREIMGKLR